MQIPDNIAIDEKLLRKYNYGAPAFIKPFHFTPAESWQEAYGKTRIWYCRMKNL